MLTVWDLAHLGDSVSSAVKWGDIHSLTERTWRVKAQMQVTNIHETFKGMARDGGGGTGASVGV